MTNFPDYFVDVADSYGRQLIEDGADLYVFERGDDEQFKIVMSGSGGCDGRYRSRSGVTYYHITIAYEVEAAVIPLIDDGWTFPEVDAILHTLPLQDQLAILHEHKAGTRTNLTTPDLADNREFSPLKAKIGREKSRSGDLIVLMRNEIGEEIAVYETVDNQFVGCVMDINAEEITWYEIEPLGGVESAMMCWLDVGYELVEYNEEAAVRIAEQIREATFSKSKSEQ